MKVLITGAGGQLGQELLATGPSGVEIVACSRADLDIADEGQVRSRLEAETPDLIINAAAFTDVDRAEAVRELAFLVNATAVSSISQWAAEKNVRLIHLSTDFVFAGSAGTPYRPGDPTGPRSVYGESKLAGEQAALRATQGKALVLRTAWLYSSYGKNFVKSMLSLMATRDRISVVTDQIGTPTWARGLAEAIWRASGRSEVRGIHHWTDAGTASWYDFAVAIQEQGRALGLLSRSVKIDPVRTSDFPSPAPRPAFSVLDKHDTWAAIKLRPPHWRYQLREMMREVRRTHAA